MKGRRYTTEDKLRILREADRGKRILEVCRAHNISEVSFHRWKRPFGQMDLSEARKLKELERENGELKKMQSRGVAQEPGPGGRRRKKMGGPAHRRVAARAAAARGRCAGRMACRIPLLARSTFWYQPPPATPAQQRLAKRLRALSEQHPRDGYRLYRRPFAPGRMGGGQTPRPAATSGGRAARAAHQTQGRAPWRLHRLADQSRTPWTRVDVGVHQRCHGARRGVENVDPPR